MWDTPSAIIGIFIGIMIAVIFGWISYQTRILVFTACPKELRHCTKSQYFTDPGDALADGGDINNLLYLNDEDKMYYHRRPNTTCRPGPKQDIHMVRPEYCMFNTDDGKTVEGKSLGFNLPNYHSTHKVNGETINIIAPRDCNPQYNTGKLQLTGGTPLLKWDET